MVCLSTCLESTNGAMPRGRQGRRRNGLESEGNGGKSSKRKQASGTDSIGSYCRCSRIAFLVPRTRPTPHDLDDVDPQCHLVRTPTPDEAFSPASWPSYTRLDRDAVSLSRHGIGWFGGALMALGLAALEAGGLRR